LVFKFNNFIYFFIIILFIYHIYIVFFIFGDWGLGIGDWGLGIGDLAQSPKPKTPNPIFFNILL